MSSRLGAIILLVVWVAQVVCIAPHDEDGKKQYLVVAVGPINDRTILGHLEQTLVFLCSPVQVSYGQSLHIRASPIQRRRLRRLLLRGSTFLLGGIKAEPDMRPSRAIPSFRVC